MLTLADARHLRDSTVYRDVSWADGTRALTSTFYVLRDSPSLAAAADGAADYAFYWYRGALDGRSDTAVDAAAVHARSGGLLVVAVSADPMAGEHDRIADEIRAAYQLPDGADVTLATVPIAAGTVALAFAAETPADGGAEFSAAVLGGGPARGTGTTTTTFAVDLTADGAGLLAAALDGGQALLAADFDLLVPYVLDDVSLRVWCDVDASLRTTQALATSGQLTPSGLVRALTAQHLAGSSLTSSRSLSDDERQTLDELSAHLLSATIPAALLGPDGQPVPYSATLEQRLNLTLTGTYPAALSIRRTANLALPADAPGRVSTFDLGTDRLLAHIEVSAAGDLTARGIALIVARLDYRGTSETGQAITRTSELTLRPGAATAVARFDLATPDQRALIPHVEVHFADGSAPYAFDLPPTDSESIALDIDSLGVLAVDLALGALDPASAPAVVVELSYPGGATPLAGTRILTPGSPHATWTATVRESPGPYRYRTTWTAGSRRVVSDWQASTAPSLVLDAPLELTTPTTTITAISAGDFTDLSALVVELRVVADAPVSVLRFTAPGQTSIWTLTGSAVPAAYQVRQTVLLASGGHAVAPWREETRTVLVVRDVLRYDITVVGRLLGLGVTAAKAVVEVQGPDAAAPTSTVVLELPEDEPVCTVRLADPEQRSYRYRVTVSPTSGAPRTSTWLTDSSSILVLRPPP